jgi:glycerol-3-phosphate dehydrogenase
LSFSHKDRLKNIKRLEDEVFDLIIVGGGITGAGIARDAVSRGMKVALVESDDFAIGTSSRSSKLIHGGIRYLENFEFSLVFEALTERALLFKIAPHLVHPLRFIIPIYKSSRVGYWKMLAGMWLYDLLSLMETPQMHESLGINEVKERVPSINARELVGALEYSDAYMDDDRLVIETLRDAARKGACIVNYVKVTKAKVLNNQIVEELFVEDKMTGDTFAIKSKQVVSGVGPWTDIFGKVIDKNWINKLRPTKGVHLVFSKKKIPLEKAVVMAVEKRIIFVIPRHEMVIVGTTDTDFTKDPKDVETNIDDVQYLITALNQYFPNLQIQATDIVSSYCGVRPLVDDGASTEGKTSREHSIFSHGPNLTFVAGGKYTTYRKISQEVVDHILNKMNFSESMSFTQSNTKVSLNPQISQTLYERAKLKKTLWSQEYQLNEQLVEKLIERHGEEAEVILKKIIKNFNIYSPNEAFWMGEAYFAIKNTMCLNLVDFYWRRSPLFLASKSHGVKYVKPIAKVFATELNWSPEKTLAEENNLMEQMHKELSWKSKTEDFLNSD